MTRKGGHCPTLPTPHPVRERGWREKADTAHGHRPDQCERGRQRPPPASWSAPTVRVRRTWASARCVARLRAPSRAFRYLPSGSFCSGRAGPCGCVAIGPWLAAVHIVVSLRGPHDRFRASLCAAVHVFVSLRGSSVRLPASLFGGVAHGAVEGAGNGKSLPPSTAGLLSPISPHQLLFASLRSLPSLRRRGARRSRGRRQRQAPSLLPWRAVSPHQATSDTCNDNNAQRGLRFPSSTLHFALRRARRTTQ